MEGPKNQEWNCWKTNIKSNILLQNQLHMTYENWIDSVSFKNILKIYLTLSVVWGNVVIHLVKNDSDSNFVFLKTILSISVEETLMN